MNYKLDVEEQEILDAFEQNELQSVPNVSEQIEAAKAAARNTTLKTHRVNLRLTERDFYLAHVKASEEGLPYQTLLYCGCDENRSFSTEYQAEAKLRFSFRA